MLQGLVRRTLFAFTALALPGLTAAQSSNATLTGAIMDSGGGVLPGVAVKLESPATGLQREAVTNASGLYTFNFLPAGEYVITAELSGFKSVRHDGVRLEIGQNRALDMKLEVGRIQETVTVLGTAALLDTMSARQMQLMLRMNY
jgi:carboxypeptidase family protein